MKDFFFFGIARHNVLETGGPSFSYDDHDVYPRAARVDPLSERDVARVVADFQSSCSIRELSFSWITQLSHRRRSIVSLWEKLTHLQLQKQFFSLELCGSKAARVMTRVEKFESASSIPQSLHHQNQPSILMELLQLLIFLRATEQTLMLNCLSTLFTQERYRVRGQKLHPRN